MIEGQETKVMSVRDAIIEAMSEEEYLALFAGTAVKRAGLAGLQRTMRDLRNNFTLPIDTISTSSAVRRFIRPTTDDTTSEG